ncbi:MAG: transcription-repair coupling factor [Butyrivibrio sp.]|nr:transcription-repair coupling factor [Butyrivibrio sp.]
MKALDAPLSELDAYNGCRRWLEQHTQPVSISGLVDEARLHIMSVLSGDFRFRLIIAPDDLRAHRIAEEYEFFDRNVMEYPAKDLIFYQADIHGAEAVARRLKCLRRIVEKRPMTLVTTIGALMTPQLPAEIYRAHCLNIDRHDMLRTEEIAQELTRIGYTRAYQVEAPGEFALRGDIIDVYDLTQEYPYRIELWGDEVDSIRFFDLLSQRSIDRLESISIFPATELVLEDDRLQEGLEAIRRDCAANEAALRADFHTEEAHRLKTNVEELVEQAGLRMSGINLESYVRYFYEDTVSLLELLPADATALFVEEPGRVREHAEQIYYEFRESMIHRAQTGNALPGQMALLSSPEQTVAHLLRRRMVLLSLLPLPEQYLTEFDVHHSFEIASREIAPYNNSFDALEKDLKQAVRNRRRTLILSGSRTRAKRLAADLTDRDIHAFYSEDPSRILQPGEVMTYYGAVNKGFEYTDLGLLVIAESDIFTEKKRKNRRHRRHFEGGERISSFADLKPGDYVIHEDHGLGIFRGIEKLSSDGVTRDYIKIEYADGANLYVLATGLDVIQKYLRGEVTEDGEVKTKSVRLNRLGGNEWQRTKTKVRTAVEVIAQDLVELYARRQAAQGMAFSPDSVWQREFEDAFPYQETEDQLNAIEETKADMESGRIMDRLICGDVGFGKTEIAIRAAFKAVQDGKQVAVLVPTTILAQQHFNTFTERMKSFPVTVDMLSRFRTKAEQTRTIEGLKKGRVDIIIGTHRLLSKDVIYKDLGLLVVDEEQRFGVTHKEKIKQLKENVDVLTLTATPIPRTLHMSLVGIRDMSVLEEAPGDRLPIQTFVCEYNEELIREAILRELARKGQIYYVYNRVNDIADVAARLVQLVPEARIGFAHGQMNENELERIMYDFIDGSIDVLVSTTIIETGLDIPNVNTMIIHDADKMGLAQLYQLRGRVGRSNRGAYAFLMYRRGKLLREEAEKRLSAIREFTDLGSGYKIAMRDLEIRGAGNLLGRSQSGHMAAVGYDLYCKMLGDAVKRRKELPMGQVDPASADPAQMKAPEPDFTTSVDIEVSAFLPPEYIPDEMHKLELYKRIADIENEDDRSEMHDELVDRFGPLPREAENLLRIALIRAKAHRLYIMEIKSSTSGAEGEVALRMRTDARIRSEAIPDFLSQTRGRIRFIATGTPTFLYHYKPRGNRQEISDKLLSDTESLLDMMTEALL